jgi:hypothetical protein
MECSIQQSSAKISSSLFLLHLVPFWILDFGFAFARRCASNFLMVEAWRSKDFSLRTAASFSMGITATVFTRLCSMQAEGLGCLLAVGGQIEP